MAAAAAASDQKAQHKATMARVTAESKRLRRARIDICVFLSIGLIFLLASFLFPGISVRYKILCWQTAMVTVFATAVTIKRNPVVWYPVIYRWSVRLTQKSYPPRAASASQNE